MVFNKVAKKIVDAQIKYPKKFIWTFLILNLLLIPGIFNLVHNVEPSLEKVLPQSVDEIKNMNYMRSQFGADMIYLVAYANDGVVNDVRDLGYLRYIDILDQKIQDNSDLNIIQVNSIASIVKNLNGGNLPLTYTESKNLFKKYSDILSDYHNADYSLSMISIQTNTGSSAELVANTINKIKDDIALTQKYNPGVNIKLTGFGAIDKATFSVIMSDFLVITMISMLFVAIIVFIAFKSLVKGMLPMTIVVNALIWTMGMVGYLNLTLTVVSMVAAAMIMGLGISFGIHEVFGYYEKKKKLSSKKALEEVMSELLRALLGASLTTIAGFLALLAGVLPAMKILGIILALGILNTLIGAIFLLPVVIYLYDVKSKKV